MSQSAWVAAAYDVTGAACARQVVCDKLRVEIHKFAVRVYMAAPDALRTVLHRIIAPQCVIENDARVSCSVGVVSADITVRRADRQRATFTLIDIMEDRTSVGGSRHNYRLAGIGAYGYMSVIEWVAQNKPEWLIDVPFDSQSFDYYIEYSGAAAVLCMYWYDDNGRRQERHYANADIDREAMWLGISPELFQDFLAWLARQESVEPEYVTQVSQTGNVWQRQCSESTDAAVMTVLASPSVENSGEETSVRPAVAPHGPHTE